MPRRIAALALFVVFAFAFPAGAGAHSVVRHGVPNHRITRSTSTNWAGYSATGGRFTSVSATWKQPAATCTAATAYSSFWVGLDGDGTNTVEQIGTDADCSGGKPVYYAWYEMYPKFPVNLSLTIQPRRHGVGHRSRRTASGSFTLTIRDTTTGGSFTTVQKLRHAKLGSAEVIAEAPSSGGVLPLANFGTVGFSAATVNGQPIGSFHPDRINMVSGTTTKATTSALSSGNAFSVTWNHA